MSPFCCSTNVYEGCTWRTEIWKAWILCEAPLWCPVLSRQWLAQSGLWLQQWKYPGPWQFSKREEKNWSATMVPEERGLPWCCMAKMASDHSSSGTVLLTLPSWTRQWLSPGYQRWLMPKGEFTISRGELFLSQFEWRILIVYMLEWHQNWDLKFCGHFFFPSFISFIFFCKERFISLRYCFSMISG